MSRILLLDNYDSFTWNLVHYLETLTEDEICVFRNDEISLEDVAQYDRIVLSPGPGMPSEAGILIPLIKKYAATKPILGVCLGHQAIAEAFGGTLLQLAEVIHGLQRKCILAEEKDDFFKTIPNTFEVGRYHSWVVNEETLPLTFKVLARDEQSNIMVMKHIDLPVYSVQFHPESVMTAFGKQLLQNWLEITS